MALHARIEGVEPDDWEHPSLVQTWAPRGAVYVVPAADLWVFATGMLPRDQARLASMHDARLGRRKLAAAASGVLLRWDTRSSVALPVRETLEGDPEAARLELARRFLRSLGPATPAGLMRYAAVDRSDAAITFQRLEPELVEVSVEGSPAGWLLGVDAEALTGAAPVLGARLLPNAADPVLQPSTSHLLGVRPRGGHLEVLGLNLPPWCVSGVILHNGATVGTYGRRSGEFVLVPLRPLTPDAAAEIEQEAWSAPILSGVTRVVWRRLDQSPST
jgi:hypothetical protein